MTEPPPTHHEPQPSVAAEVGRAGVSLLEAWARDTLVGGAVLFSLIACLAGFAGDGPGWIVLGLAVGLPGAVLPFVAVARWSVPVTWLVSLVALLASLAVVVAVAAS